MGAIIYKDENEERGCGKLRWVWIGLVDWWIGGLVGCIPLIINAGLDYDTHAIRVNDGG